jgi:hypothetical protein
MADPPPTPYQRVLLQGIDISANVRRVEVEDHDRLIDRAIVELDDPAGLAREAPREGNTLVVEVGWADTHAAIFEGEVTRVQTREAGCEVARARLTALDFACRIQKRPFVPTNHTGTLSSIMATLVARAPDSGITIGQILPQADPQYSATAPLRQTQNDWEFITEQARRSGCIAFVEFNADKSKFYFVPLDRILQGQPAGTLSNIGTSGRIVSISLNREAGTADARRTSASIDRTTGAIVTQPAPPAAPEPAQQPSARALDAADRAGAPIDSAMLVAAQATDAPASQRPERFAVAARPGDAPQDPTRAYGWSAKGSCVGAVMLRAKSQIELTGVASWAETKWYVRRAKHIVVTPRPAEQMIAGYTTEFELSR